MIGHITDSLTQVQEDRLLVGKLCVDQLFTPSGEAGCFIGQIYDMPRRAADGVLGVHPNEAQIVDLVFKGVGLQYNALCRRFGEARINAAIRNRILSNRARRALTAPAPASTAQAAQKEVAWVS